MLLQQVRRGFTLIELMIVIAIIAIIAAIAIPGLLASQRASNERNASTSLKTITAAEADFRSNDRDGNKVNDFWTANVAGLYTMTSGAITGAIPNSTTDPSIKLIDLSLASADADSNMISAGGENLSITNFALPSPKAQHWYNALVSDGNGVAPDNVYRQDTGGTPVMGTVHNLWRFAFTCWPDSASAGKFIYIVDENNTIHRSALTSSVKPTLASPPGTALSPYDVYPSDTNLKSFWAKLD
jgi:prepilin-type N-terminal cleavage/methylation domain-containing protein